MVWDKMSSEDAKSSSGFDKDGNFRVDKISDFQKDGSHDHHWAKASPKGEYKEGYKGSKAKK